MKVTCAIILSQKKILVVQRSEHMKMPLKWEFPGGKLEQGEAENHGIKREIKEELDIEIDVNLRLTPVSFPYPEGTIELIPFVATHIGGTVKLAEHKEYRLLEKEKLRSLDWAEADIPILNEFLRL
jgi:8-oxo-dGTP diphosphatase